MTKEYSRIVVWLFEIYLNVRFFLSFKTVHYDVSLTRSLYEPNLPTVFISNHMSWWDGFFVLLLRKHLGPKKVHHFVALERELQKFPILKKIGAIGIIPNQPDNVSACFLNLKTLFESSSNVSLAYFPQGKIMPIRSRPLQFKQGIERLLSMLPPCQVIPVALNIEPLRSAKPTVYIKTGLPILSAATKITTRDLEQRIEALLEDVTLSQPIAELASDHTW